MAGVLMLACTTSADEATGPDTRALVRSYREPSLSLTQANASRVVAALDRKVEGLSVLCGFDGVESITCAEEGCGGCPGLSPLFDALDALRGGPDADGGAQGALSEPLSGDGFILVSRICPGHETKATDPANGTVELVVGFSDAGFEPVLFGAFYNCRISVSGAANTLDGTYSLSFSGPWGLEGLHDLRPVLALEGVIATPSGRLSIGSNLQLGLGVESSLALSCELDGGDNVVFFQDARGAGFRAKNGDFICDFSDGTCRGDDATVRLR
jgi:hypothetical protein